MALFYLDQLYYPKGDTIRKFGGTQSLFIQFFFLGGGGYVFGYGVRMLLQ